MFMRVYTNARCRMYNESGHDGEKKKKDAIVGVKDKQSFSLIVYN